MQAQKQITVVNKLGLHARAAAKLARCAGEFNSAIRLQKADKEADAKSILAVMMLAATQGSELQLVARGDDATAAAHAISELFADYFGEGE